VEAEEEGVTPGEHSSSISIKPTSARGPTDDEPEQTALFEVRSHQV